MYFDPYWWIDQCMLMIAERYGFDRVIYDRRSYKWFEVFDFPLSEWWRQPSTTLFVKLPPVGNILIYPPDYVYVDQGLRTLSGLMVGHYYEDGEGFNDMAHEGWARLSLHMESWRPSPDVVSGNNLLDLVELVYYRMSEWAKQAEGVW